MDLSAIAGKKFVVIGDVIVDHYRVLRPSRVSPEAPVLIFHPEKDYKVPGGAANVANNLISMGADTNSVFICSVVGDDYLGALAPMERLLGCQEILVEQAGRKTTVKERLVTRRQQITRIDIQSGDHVMEESATALRERVLSLLPGTDVVVFSDYDHGVMVPTLVGPIIRACIDLGIRMVVDSKAQDTQQKYRACTVALPNYAEARRFSGCLGDDDEMARYILARMRLDALAITMGAKGILLALPGQVPTLHPPLDEESEEEVVDVTGAGDTVTSAIAIGMALGMPYDGMVRMANVAAGIAVKKQGVATVSGDEVLATMRARNMEI